MQNFFPNTLKAMKESYAQVSTALERNKVAISLAATGMGTYYIYLNLKPWGTEVSYMLEGLYHFARHGINHLTSSGGDSVFGDTLGTGQCAEAGTPLGRQFQKIIATGDKLLEIQLLESTFLHSDSNSEGSKGLFKKINYLFNLKALREQLKGKDKKDRSKLQKFVIAGVAQTITAVLVIDLLSVTTKVILSIFHRHGLHEHVRAAAAEFEDGKDTGGTLDIEKLLSDPKAFEDFIKKDAELERLCANMSVVEATQNPRVLARIIKIISERGGPNGVSIAERRAMIAAKNQEIADKAGKEMLNLLRYFMGAGLENLAKHVEESVARVIQRKGNFVKKPLAAADLSNFLLEVLQVMDTRQSLAASGAKEGKGEFEDQSRRSNCGGNEVKAKEFERFRYSNYILPEWYRRDLEDVKESNEDHALRVRTANMTAELREVLRTSSFEKLVRVSAAEALKMVGVCMEPQFQPPNAKNGKIGALMAVVRLSKFCRTMLPFHASPKKTPSSTLDSATSSSEPQEKIKEESFPPRDPRVIHTICLSKTVKRFCHVIFFPMDGRLHVGDMMGPRGNPFM
eukprot:jgi/Bigna1/88734/estExt_fgenesh1_pg.C_370075